MTAPLAVWQTGKMTNRDSSRRQSGIKAGGRTIYEELLNPRSALRQAMEIASLMEKVEPTLQALALQSSLPITIAMEEREASYKLFASITGAVAEAKRQRDMTLPSLEIVKLIEERDRVQRTLDGGLSDIARMVLKDQDLFGKVLAEGAYREPDLQPMLDGVRALRAAALSTPNMPALLSRELEEHVEQLQDATDELTQCPSSEDRTALATRLVSILAGFAHWFAKNSRDELLKMGFFATLSLYRTLEGILASHAAAGMTPEQSQLLSHTHDQVALLSEQIENLASLEAQLDEAWVSNLPRAELRATAMVRTSPGRSGDALYRAPTGTLLAIAGRQGEWLSAIYRDPLTDQLAQGWVYGRSVKIL